MVSEQELIEQATELAAKLRAREGVYRRAAHVIDNALRSARITKHGTGILHRQPIPYARELENIEASMETAKKILLETL